MIRKVGREKELRIPDDGDQDSGLMVISVPGSM
jgi:hypothetical protein